MVLYVNEKRKDLKIKSRAVLSYSTQKEVFVTSVS